MKKKFIDQIVGIDEFHLWISLPRGYTFFHPPELPHVFHGCESIMFEEKKIQEGRFFKEIHYLKKWQNKLLKHKEALISIIALILAILSLLRTI